MLSFFKESLIMAAKRQAYWQEIIDTQAASGLTKAEFFKSNNISSATYYYWFKKINTQVKVNRNHIIPIEITPQSHISPHQTVELLFPNGYQLSFEASIEPTNLKQILLALNS